MQLKGIVIIIVVMFFSFNGFAQKTAIGNNTSVSVKLSTGNDSIQYALGAYLGQYIYINGFVISNPTLFKKGLEDAMNGKPLLISADSVEHLMKSYEKRSVSERNGKQEKLLFDKVKLQPGMGILPSGVCYTIIKVGTGKRPQLNDSVSLHLKGFFADGKNFEDTYPKNTPYKTTPNNIIAGMKEILEIMPVGSLWRVYIPSASAFGEKGLAGIIPPYSALIYEVELLSITETPQKPGK